jgi:RNA polymerase sigma factor (sigma-70 family)
MRHRVPVATMFALALVLLAGPSLLQAQEASPSVAELSVLLVDDTGLSLRRPYVGSKVTLRARGQGPWNGMRAQGQEQPPRGERVMTDGSLPPPRPASTEPGIPEPGIRVVLVDDHLVFRQPLAFMLMQEPDITVIGQAGSVAEARPLLPRADIVLIALDLDRPDGEGVALLHEVRTITPRPIALVLTGNGSPGAMARAVEAGAAGVLPTSHPVRAVVDAIRRLHAGESLLSLRETIELLRFIHRQRDQDRVAQAVIDRLTPQEREVLQALAAGLSDREIAHQLGVSPDTVRTHLLTLLDPEGVEQGE